MTSNPTVPKRYWETSDFWKDAGERVITAFVWGALITMGQDAANGGADISGWQVALGAGIGAALSAAKAIVGSLRSKTTTPVSLT